LLGLAAAGAVVLTAAACDLVAPNETVVPALIVGVTSDEPDISVPATAEVGQDVVVRVTSYGLSGCWRKGETQASVDGLDATVRPFDVEPDDGSICTANIPVFTHEATVRFEEAGTGTVTVHGRQLQGRSPVSFTREITVTGGS
jgi:hypothetical protein